MRYIEIKPAAELSQYVECFWTLEGDANDSTFQPESLLPDGCAELILNFGARFEEHTQDGQQLRQPINFVVGQMTQPILIAPTGVVQLIGIRFHPGGTLPFFRIPMHELTNRVTDLGALSSKFERDLLARAGKISSSLTRLASVEKLLIEQVRAFKGDSLLVNLVAKMLRRGGQVSVGELAGDAGVSCRQLERRFLGEVGLGPKLLCRILRFQQVFRAVDRNDAGWAAVAADCGYYDQAHLIRDFSQFSGQTPVGLFDRQSALTESFTRKNRMSDFSNTTT
jgi:AraC-like DNA-binding protein